MKLMARAPTLMLAALIAALFEGRVKLIYTLNINWDEFHFLAQVHTYLRGELSSAKHGWDALTRELLAPHCNPVVDESWSDSTLLYYCEPK